MFSNLLWQTIEHRDADEKVLMDELESTGVAFDEAQRQNGQAMVFKMNWFSINAARLVHELKEQDDNRMRIVNGSNNWICVAIVDNKMYRKN